MTLVIEDRDGRGAYRLTVRRMGTDRTSPVELVTVRGRVTDRTVIAADEWNKLCNLGRAL